MPYINIYLDDLYQLYEEEKIEFVKFCKFKKKNINHINNNKYIKQYNINYTNHWYES